MFNQPYLHLSGDPNFHMVMVEAGLMRGNAILSGLPHKAIMANKYEYWLVDYDDEMRFCEKYDLAEEDAEATVRDKAIKAFCAANCPKGCSFGADGNIGCGAKARFIQKLNEE